MLVHLQPAVREEGPHADTEDPVRIEVGRVQKPEQQLGLKQAGADGRGVGEQLAKETDPRRDGVEIVSAAAPPGASAPHVSMTTRGTSM